MSLESSNLSIHRRASGRRKEKERRRGTGGGGACSQGEPLSPSAKCFQKVALPQIQRSNKFFTAPEHLKEPVRFSASRRKRKVFFLSDIGTAKLSCLELLISLKLF